MFYRRLGLGCMALALAAFVSMSVARAEDKAEVKKKGNTHVGTFVSAKGNELTMKGKNGKEHTHTLTDDAKVIGEDGKTCKIDELKEGAKIRVTTKDEDDKKVVTRVEVVRKKNKDNDN